MAAKTSRRRHALIVTGIVAGALATLVALGVALRDPIASAIGAHALAAQGLRCDRVAIHVGASLLRMEPTRCESTRAPLRSVRFGAPVWIHLSGLGVAYATCEAVDMDLIARDDSDVRMDLLGSVARVVGLDQPAMDVMTSFAALSDRPLPPFFGRHVTLRRGGHPVVQLDDMRMRYSDAGLRVLSPHARVLELALLGDASIRLWATSERAHLTIAFHHGPTADVDGDHLREHPSRARFSVQL